MNGANRGSSPPFCNRSRYPPSQMIVDSAQTSYHTAFNFENPMQTNELIPFIQAQLEDSKALDIVVLDVKKLSNTIDAMIIATATSSRHAQSVAKKLVDAIKTAGMRPLGVEGDTFGEWILIDCYDVLVHVMLKEQRELYNLEKLWSVTEEHIKSNKQ